MKPSQRFVLDEPKLVEHAVECPMAFCEKLNVFRSNVENYESAMSALLSQLKAKVGSKYLHSTVDDVIAQWEAIHADT